MIRSAYNKRNIAIFYRALEYLNAYNTLQSIDVSVPTVPADELVTKLVTLYNMLKKNLQAEILIYQGKFKILGEISIDNGNVTKVKDVDPSILREWIEDAYNSESSMSNKLTDVGIQNSTDYLILYDKLYNHVFIESRETEGGSAAEDDMKTIPMADADADAEAEAKDDCGAAKVGNDETWWQSLELDADLIQQEEEIIMNAIVPASHSLLKDIDTQINEIYCIENNTELRGTVDSKVLDITSNIFNLLDGVTDVDFLETLYYILQQFIYFNEMNGQYITLERLSNVTLNRISTTIDKILTIAETFNPNIRLEEEIEWVKIKAARDKATAEAVTAEYAAQPAETAGAAAVAAAAAVVAQTAKTAPQQPSMGMPGMGMDAMKAVPNINITTRPLPPQTPAGAAEEGAAEADDVNSIDIEIPDIVYLQHEKPLMTNALKTARILANNGQPTGRGVGGPERTGRRAVRPKQPYNSRGIIRTPSPKGKHSLPIGFKPITPMEIGGGANKTRKNSKSSQLRKTLKKRRVKKIKRKSLRRKKPIKKRVNSKNRKVKRKIKNKTKKYKKPKKQKRSRKPKPKP